MSQAQTAGCPECDGRLTADGDETVCSNCGLVVGTDRLDRGPEWRSFADDDTNPERTGAPLTRSRHDRGLSTEIGHTRVKGRKRRKFARLRRQHDRTKIRSKRERNQVYGFTEIRRMTDVLGLPDHVRDQACMLFRSAQKESLLRGRSIEGFSAACLYAACRVDGIARTVEEVIDVAKATVNEHEAAYDAMNRELGLPIGPVPPVEYLARFASQLSVSPTVERRARELAGRAREEQIDVGRDPSGVAAACLYTAAQTHGDMEVTQAEAADVADVTPVTIRNTFHDLSD